MKGKTLTKKLSVILTLVIAAIIAAVVGVSTYAQNQPAANAADIAGSDCNNVFVETMTTSDGTPSGDFSGIWTTNLVIPEENGTGYSIPVNLKAAAANPKPDGSNIYVTFELASPTMSQPETDQDGNTNTVPESGTYITVQMKNVNGNYPLFIRNDGDSDAEDPEAKLDENGNVVRPSIEQDQYSPKTEGTITIPASTMTYDVDSGILSFGNDSVTIDGKQYVLRKVPRITVYNYLTDAQYNVDRNYYGAVYLRGSDKSDTLRNDLLSGTTLQQFPINDETMIDVKQLPYNNGINIVLPEIPGAGSSATGDYGKYEINDYKIYSVTVKDGKITHAFPLSPGVFVDDENDDSDDYDGMKIEPEYTYDSDSDIIKVSNTVNASNIVVVAYLSLPSISDVITPRLAEAGQDFLSFYAGPVAASDATHSYEYSYVLYHKEKNEITNKKEVHVDQTKTEEDVNKNTGIIKFTNLSKNQTYYIKYKLTITDKTNPKASPVVKTKTKKVATLPGEIKFDTGTLAPGDKFNCTVMYLNSGSDSWAGFYSGIKIWKDGKVVSLEGNMSHGHSAFSCKVSNITATKDAKKDDATILRKAFSGANGRFYAGCVNAGYHRTPKNTSVSGVLTVLTISKNGEITAEVKANGGRPIRGTYQSVVGNVVSDTVPPKGRITIEKSSIKPKKTHENGDGVAIENEYYKVKGTEFEIYKASDWDKDNQKPNPGAKAIETLVADEDGWDISDPLDYGVYYVRETKSPDNYNLNKVDTPEPKRVRINAANPTPKKEFQNTPDLVKVTMTKKSTTTKVDGNKYYDFEGIQYEMKGKTYGHKFTFVSDALGNITICDADGKTLSDDTTIPYDEYSLIETKTNACYYMNTKQDTVIKLLPPGTDGTICQETTDENGVKTITANISGDDYDVLKDEPRVVYLDLKKISVDPTITKTGEGEEGKARFSDGHPLYDLRHAIYTITNNNKDRKDLAPSAWLPEGSKNTMETGVVAYGKLGKDSRLNGYAKSTALYVDDYLVKETQTPRTDGGQHGNYALNDKEYTISGTDLKQMLIDTIQDQTNEDKLVYRVADDAQGNIPENAQVDFTFTINKPSATPLNAEDLTEITTVANRGQGKANLSAIFEIRYFPTLDDSQKNRDEMRANNQFEKFYVKTDENGHASLQDIKVGEAEALEGDRTAEAEFMNHTISGADDPYHYKYITENVYKKDGKVVLPVGVIEIQEVVAPNGYLYDNDRVSAIEYNKKTGSYKFIGGATHCYKLVGSPNTTEYNLGNLTNFTKTTVDKEKNPDIHKERVFRGDFKLQKKDEGTKKVLAGIPFLITSKTTGESHVIVTDKKGRYVSYTSAMLDTWNITSDTTSHDRIDNGKNHVNLNDKLLDTNNNGRIDTEEAENAENITINSADLDLNSATWFYGYGPKNNADNFAEMSEKVKPINTVGALPYDDYTIQELRVSGDEKLGLDKNVGLGLLNDKFSISTDGAINHEFDLEDPELYIGTTATALNNSNSQQGNLTGDTVTIIDEISYNGLDRTKKYRMVGTLMNKDTGKELVDDEGNTFVKEIEFTPKGAIGALNMEFNVPASIVPQNGVVVFEKLYEKDGKKTITEHEDINNAEQTVSFPSVHTTATDSVTGDHYGQVANEVITVVDAVKCTGLVVGKEYTITGTLMNRATGKELVGDDGATYTATEKFTAEQTDPTIELKFEVPRNVIAGQTVVVFEDLYHNGIPIGTHADLNDEEQTVYYPKVHTTATDNVTNNHIGLIDETVRINDLVKYDNLIFGKKYRLDGKLMDKATGESLKTADGKEITASVEFIAGVDTVATTGGIITEEDYNAAVKTIDDYKARVKSILENVANLSDKDKTDAGIGVLPTEYANYESALNGITEKNETDNAVNMFTTLEKNYDGINKLAATYTNIPSVSDMPSFNDVIMPAAQKIYQYNKIQAEKAAVEAAAANTNNEAAAATAPENNANAENNANTENKADENKTDENKADETKKETVKYVSGEVLVSFDAPKDVVMGKQTVVFEDLYYNNPAVEGEWQIVGDHKDINDEGQTVYYPEIRTLAHTNNENDQHVLDISNGDSVAKFVDTITYKGLQPNQKYRAEGVLMDKDTESELLDANGEKIMATAEFIPTEADGTVDVEFSLDTSIFSSMPKKQIVVFEEVYLVTEPAPTPEGNTPEGDKLIGQHKDLNDTDQTIKVVSVLDELIEAPNPLEQLLEETPIPLGQLGDAGIVLLVVGMVYAGGMFYATRVRRRDDV